MPVNTQLAQDQWNRYTYMRDNGHLAYLEKANKCERFYAGDQWEPIDKAALAAVRRPALTINKILSTVNSLTGDQINLRSETTFKPVHTAGENLSSVMELLYKQTAAQNLLQYLETDVFEDGAITSRGFFDVRLRFTNNLQGEIEITAPNPRNVVIDPDGEKYDPDTWKDVIETKWLSPNDIEVQYNREDADYLRANDSTPYSTDLDSVQRASGRFGGIINYSTVVGSAPEIQRSIRVLDRQHKVITKAKFFVDLQTGDMRQVPENWDKARIKLVMDTYGLGVIDRLVERWRWTTTAGDVVLHDEWSPYKHCTFVPFFPLFRHGKTIGVVENLLDPQELLNKVSSQELHVVNGVANSGWKIKQGSLRNMEVEELEQRGAMTGIVLELDNIEDAEKIQPNTVPTGLERISYKAEEHIKTISNVTDTSLGDDRADVAAKAIKAKSARQGVSQLRLQDNLMKTKHLLAIRVVDIWQQYYTEPRIYRMTFDHPVNAGMIEQTEEEQFIKLNQFDDATGRIMNDLTLGQYETVITTMPPKDTQEESEFEQCIAMRELGIMIPDDEVISHSLLKRKRDIVRKMAASANSPEAQQQKQLQLQAQVAQVDELEAQAENTKADSLLKTANAQSKAAEIATAAPGAGPAGDGGKDLASQVLQNRADRATQAADHELRRQEMDHEAGMQAREQAHDMNTKAVDKAIGDDDAAQAHARGKESGETAHKQSKELENTKATNAVKVAKAKPKTTPKTAAK